MSELGMTPAMEDRDTRGFFEAAAEGRLVIRACQACERFIHPPTTHCPHCGSMRTDWRPVAGEGTLYAWTTVTHQVHPKYPTPYTIIVVDVSDAPGVRLAGRLDGAPQLEMGMAMRVWFDALPNGGALPQWAPA